MYQTMFLEGVGSDAAACLHEIRKLMQLHRIRPTGGELTAEPATLITPLDDVFVCFTFNGDVEAWRAAIELFARARCAEIAEIDFGALTLESGVSFPVNECRVVREAGATAAA